MACQGTVTRLAPDPGVRSRGELLGFDIVAVGTRQATGVPVRDSAVVVEGTGAKVAELAEVGRNEDSPQDEKHDRTDGEKPSHPDEMLRVLEWLGHAEPRVTVSAVEAGLSEPLLAIVVTD
jgi:hypothetical protein